jgi:hypothetical protein
MERRFTRTNISFLELCLLAANDLQLDDVIA